MTYSDMTSGGKLRGIIPALSHNALSLVHVQNGGQRGCLALLLSTTSKTDATTSKPSQGDLLGIFRTFSMLAKRCGHDLRVKHPMHMHQALRCGSFSTAAAWRPSDALSALVYLRDAAAAAALEIKTRRPVCPQRCNYTTPPDIKINIPCDKKIKSSQIRAAVVRAQENTSWRADKRGVTAAGGDPSGSRRSISIQNHAYDFGKRHTLSVSSSGRFPPNRQRNCVIYGESAGENEVLT